MTDSGYTKINLAAGDVFSEAACDALDNQIDELSRRFWRVDDQTWVTQNAVYTGAAWNREDIAKPAAAIRVDAGNNQTDLLFVAAGANPITWVSSVSVTADKEVVVPGALWTPYAQLLAPAAPAAGLLLHEDLTSAYRSASEYATVKSATVPAKYVEDGSAYIDFDVGGLGYIQVIGGSNTLSAPGIMTGLAAGDTIELQLQGNNDEGSSNEMFRIYAYDKPISAGEPWG
jgi:hypothetical protein